MTTDTIASFDPKVDTPRTPRKGKIKTTYERLLSRGDDDLAKELREKESVQLQLHMVNNEVPEFDPEHDSASGTREIRIRDTYEEWREAGRDEIAEELRAIRTPRGQWRYTKDVRKVDKKADELEQKGESDKATELRSFDSVKEQLAFIDDLEAKEHKEKVKQSGPRGRSRHR